MNAPNGLKSEGLSRLQEQPVAAEACIEAWTAVVLMRMRALTITVFYFIFCLAFRRG